MPEIVLTNLTKRWGKFYAVDNLNLVIDDNAFVTLLGPSGCGKTTTLRMIAGLETPTSGRITIGDTVVFDSELGINIPPNKRRVGFLFQNYALWPNMTVYQNISFGLGNVKEEAPTVDFEARKLDALIYALTRASEVSRIVNECIDKKGRLDDDRALLRLIDTFEISVYTAKTLMDYKLHEADDVSKAAGEIIIRLKAELQNQYTKQKAAGYELNDKHEVMKNGQVVKSVRKYTKEEIDLIVRRVSRIVKIGMFMDRYPSELSGGQQQRVAIARTLAPEPTVLFMDEPLSNLDAKLRLEMRSELQRLHIDTGSTFIYVTHDQMEAMTLATKICLIDNGVLQQYDKPMDVYNRPNNLFVADFVGNPAINFVEGKGRQEADGSIGLSIFDNAKAKFVAREQLDLALWQKQEDEADESARNALAEKQKDKKNVEKENADVTFKHHIAKVDEFEAIDDESIVTDNDFVIGIRPEFIKIGDQCSLEGEIYSSMPTGMEITVKIRIGQFLLTAVVFGGVLYEIGQRVKIDFEGDGIMLFSRKSGSFIAQGSLFLQ
ncbi:MAG: ABC transporter ATP-binding protein [Clostridiaceae bacterium]|jgi:ABC-type sugar transport system ATPase subunit|nr:ABC transporter ATP-binding protein [Clostridiaceae bacterium]